MTVEAEDRLLLEAAEAMRRVDAVKSAPSPKPVQAADGLSPFQVPQWVQDLGPAPTLSPAQVEEIARLEAAEERRTREEAARVEEERFCATVPRAYRWALAEAPSLPRSRVSLDGWVERAAELARSPRVILQGPAGSGKTSLAVRMIRCWRDRGARGEWVRFAHAYALGTARIQHRAGEGEPAEVRGAMSASVLLLDDLGAERDTATNAVPDVIFERHAEERPLWVTTGLTQAQIATRYGDGIARRLFERAKVVRLGVAVPEARA